MNATEAESLRTRLDSLTKRAGESSVLASMLSGQLARQEVEISTARAALRQALSNESLPSQAPSNSETKHYDRILSWRPNEAQ